MYCPQGNETKDYFHTKIKIKIIIKLKVGKMYYAHDYHISYFPLSER